MIPGSQTLFTSFTDCQTYPSPAFSTALGSSDSCSDFSFSPFAPSHSYSCLDVWQDSAISYHISTCLEKHKTGENNNCIYFIHTHISMYMYVYIWQKEYKSCKVQHSKVKCSKVRQCQTEFLKASLNSPPGEYALWYSFNYKVAYYYFSPGHLLQQGTGWMVLT